MIKVSYIKLSIFVFLTMGLIGVAVFSIAQENANSTKTIFEDADQDGLSDGEELTYKSDPYKSDTDGDGYSDGAEVKSGYDPLKPAPGDRLLAADSSEREKTSTPATASVSTDSTEQVLGETSEAILGAAETPSANQTIISSDENLTQQVSDKLATLVTEASSENKTITIDDLDAVISETVSQKLTEDDLPEIDETEIKIKKQNYSKLNEADRKAKEKEDALNYLTASSYIIINNAPGKINEPGDMDDIANDFKTSLSTFSSNPSDASFFEEIAETATKSYTELLNIEVPEKYYDLHVKGLRILKQTSVSGSISTMDPSDPISTIVYLSKINGLMSIAMDYSNEAKSEFEKLGINLDDYAALQNK